MMSPSANQKLEAKKIPLQWNTFISLSLSLSLSPQIMLQQWLKLYGKNLRKLSENCRIIETISASEQQLTLCMDTWLSHVLGKHQNN
jgi:hypothetical protein